MPSARHTDWLFAAPQADGLARQSFWGAGVNFVAQALRFALQVGATVVLARLLSPSDFGLLAMVAVLVNFIGLFTEAGLPQATVQAGEIDRARISTLFWIHFGITLCLGLLVVASAPVAVWIYGEPRLWGLATALAVPVAIAGASMQHRALLQRHMRFTAIARVDLLSYTVGVCAGLLAALYGLGYWALAIMPITTSVASTACYWGAVGWCPSLPVRGAGIRPMLRFGAGLSGFSFVTFLTRNADNFLIGKYLGTGPLGQYSRAYGFMVLPLSQVNAPIAGALLPALSRPGERSDEPETLFLKFLRLVAWTTCVPIALGAVFGERLIPLLLGQDWELAGTIFKWLALGSIIQPIVSLNGVLLTSLGQTGRLLGVGTMYAIVRVTGFAVAVYLGDVVFVAMLYAMGTYLLAPLQVLFVLKQTPVSRDAYLRCVVCPATFGLLIGICSLIPGAAG